MDHCRRSTVFADSEIWAALRTFCFQMPDALCCVNLEFDTRCAPFCKLAFRYLRSMNNLESVRPHSTVSNGPEAVGPRKRAVSQEANSGPQFLQGVTGSFLMFMLSNGMYWTASAAPASAAPASAAESGSFTGLALEPTSLSQGTTGSLRFGWQFPSGSTVGDTFLVTAADGFTLAKPVAFPSGRQSMGPVECT